MGLDQDIQITFNVNNSGIARAGFGLIGIVSHKALFSGRSKLYSRTADMVTDGFAIDSPEVIAASGILSQTPHAPTVAVLRASGSAVVQKFVIDATAHDAQEYDVLVEGEGFDPVTATYTSGVGALVAQIHSSLLTQLNAVASKNYLAAFAPLAVLTPFAFTCDHTVPHLHHTAHGLSTGDGPVRVSNSGGALPTGLAAATDYYAIRIDADNFKLATSLANALAGTAIAVTTDDGSGTQTLTPQAGCLSPTLAVTVTGSAPGNWFSLTVDSTLIAIRQTHAHFSIAAELDAIVAKDNSFFWVHTFFNSGPYAEAVAAWVEENGKAYFVDNNDSDAVQLGLGDSPLDMQFAMFGLGQIRTLYTYKKRPAEMFSARMMGLLAPKNPGMWNSKFKAPVGAVADALDPNQRANLAARRANYYTEDIPGRPFFREGTVANATYAFIDVIVSLDCVGDDLRKALAGKFLSVDSIGFDDADFAILLAGGKGTIKRMTGDAFKIMAPGDPDNPDDLPPSFTIPPAASIDPSIRALRQIPDSQLTFRLRGNVNNIKVTATVTF